MEFEITNQEIEMLLVLAEAAPAVAQFVFPAASDVRARGRLVEAIQDVGRMAREALEPVAHGVAERARVVALVRGSMELVEGYTQSALADDLATQFVDGSITAEDAVAQTLLWHEARMSVSARERLRRRALWSKGDLSPDARERATQMLEYIRGLDTECPLGEGAGLTTEEVRAIVRVVPAEGSRISHVVEAEIPEPWRSRFQEASRGSTKQSIGTSYACDWVDFLVLWDKENDLSEGP